MRIALLISLSSICLFVTCSNPAEPATITPEISNVWYRISEDGPDWYSCSVQVTVYGSTPHPMTLRIENWNNPNSYLADFVISQWKKDDDHTVTGFYNGGWGGFVSGQQYRIIINLYYNGDIIDTYESPEPITL